MNLLKNGANRVLILFRIIFFIFFHKKIIFPYFLLNIDSQVYEVDKFFEMNNYMSRLKSSLFLQKLEVENKNW